MPFTINDQGGLRKSPYLFIDQFLQPYISRNIQPVSKPDTGKVDPKKLPIEHIDILVRTRSKSATQKFAIITTLMLKFQDWLQIMP